MGHAGELLGFSVAGGDVNGDGLADIAIGAPMAGPPSRSGGGAVYFVFGSRTRPSLDTRRSPSRATRTHRRPGPPSPFGSRYDGFQQDAHMGMSLAALPDVNGDGYADIAAGAPDANLHRPGGGGVAVLYGKPHGEHISLTDSVEQRLSVLLPRRLSDARRPARRRERRARADMTGDGWPDLALGAPQADPGGRADAGSVWIISGHLPPIDAGCTGMNVDASCPWIKLNGLTAGQGYRIDGALPGEGSAPRSPASATRTATAAPTSRSALPRHRPTGGARARSS